METWVKEGEIRVLRQVEIEGVKCNIYGKKLQNGEYLLLAGTGYAKKLGEIYRKRWSIEMCFKAFKTHGFYLENTHLQDQEKLYKLIALVSIAVGLCVKFGFFLHKKKKNIKIRKHGHKANSFFRIGLDAWRKFFKEQEKELVFYVNLFLLDWKKCLRKQQVFI